MGRRPLLQLLAAAAALCLAPPAAWRPGGCLRRAAAGPRAPRGEAFAAVGRGPRAGRASCWEVLAWRRQPRLHLVRRALPIPVDDVQATMLTRIISNASTAAGVLGVIDGYIDTGIFNEIHVGAAFIRLAKLQVSVTAEVSRSEVLHALVEHTDKRLRNADADGRVVANVFWSVAHLRTKVPWVRKLLPALIEMIKFTGPYFNAQAVANTIWACAKMRLPRSQLQEVLPILARRAADKANDLKAQEISNIIWACANLRKDAPDLLNIMPEMQMAVMEQASNMEPQSVANVVWSCAVLQQEAPVLLRVLPVMGKLIIEGVDRMSEQNVANIIWGIASLRTERSHLMPTLPLLLARAFKVSGTMTLQGLSNIFWAVATVKEGSQMASYYPGFLEAVEARVDDIKPLGLENIVWAMGSMGIDSAAIPGLLNKLMAQAVKLAHAMTTQNWANMCWGLALCDHADKDFMKAVAANFVGIAPTMQDKAAMLDIPQIACAFAKLGMRHRGMMTAFSTRMSPLLPRLNDWGLCALAWSYDQLDSAGQFADFRQHLWAEAKRRRISPGRVESSQLGPGAWRRKR